ncbi:hypothetical protein [Xanthomonas bundabergensis]|uniref:hypothetical protein n=1 Tax=Xanthomonas bundabergensis TaxID=3160842 RepID=UPI003512D988
MKIPNASSARFVAFVAAAFISSAVLAYIALCLIVLYRHDWLPENSILYASLIGPPHWLAWSSGTRPMFWGCTLAMMVVAIVGASIRPLLLPSVGLLFLIWIGSGFLSVVMSV